MLAKGKKPSESDEDRFTRNVEKYQNAAKDYVLITNDAYRGINMFLDARYDNVSTLVAGLSEVEKNFFIEGAKITGFFNNVKQTALNLKPTLIPLNNPKNCQYDAVNYIRGINNHLHNNQ